MRRLADAIYAIMTCGDLPGVDVKRVKRSKARFV